jgi:hypothetical protein
MNHSLNEITQNISGILMNAQTAETDHHITMKTAIQISVKLSRILPGVLHGVGQSKQFSILVIFCYGFRPILLYLRDVSSVLFMWCRELDEIGISH